MKIIIDGKEKKTCYAQVRDLYFLAARYKSSTFEQLYENYINQGHAETDFVYLDDPRVVELINFNPFIVNFSEAVNYSQTALIRMAALTTGPVVHVDTEDNKHKRNDIFDIIDFKKGQLEYEIPVVFDKKKYVDFGKMELGSTNHPGFFLLRRKDPEVNIDEVVSKDYRVLFETLGLEGTCEGVYMFDVGEDIVFKFRTKNKKHRFGDQFKKKLGK